MDAWTTDADAMATLFTDTLTFPNENVVKLNADDGPTGDEIIAALTDLRHRLTPKDLLVIYYSGHGERGTKQDFLFCTKGAYLSHKTLLDCIEPVKAKVVIIIDACYAGCFAAARATAKTKAPMSFNAGDMRAWMKGSGRLVMVAARANATAPGSSAFTYAVINAVRLEAERSKPAREQSHMCLHMYTIHIHALLT